LRLKTQRAAVRKASELSGMKRILPFSVAVAGVLSLFSCVGPQSYEQLAATNDSLVTANTRMVADARQAALASQELEGRIVTLEKANARMARDTARYGIEAREAGEELARLRELNEALSAQGSQGLAALADENRSTSGHNGWRSSNNSWLHAMLPQMRYGSGSPMPCSASRTAD
jgi:hypothetical protein